jgi:hypothetical protein
VAYFFDPAFLDLADEPFFDEAFFVEGFCAPNLAVLADDVLLFAAVLADFGFAPPTTLPTTFLAISETL